MERWFRSYHGAPTDPKWRVIALRAGTQPGVVAAIWWALMDHASQQSPRGNVSGFDPELIAVAFGWEQEIVEAVLQAIRDKGLINEDGFLVAWNKRQPNKEDGSAARSRQWREAQKTAENKAERKRTQTNETELQIRKDKIREESVTDVTDTPHSPPECEQAVETYNALAGELSLARVQRLTKQRRKALLARLKEAGGIEGWAFAMAKVRDSPFLRGDNARGWRADFDFLLQARSFTKLMEGGYDRANGPGGGERSSNAFAAALAEQALAGRYGPGADDLAGEDSGWGEGASPGADFPGGSWPATGPA